jgi:hypothetical protein
MPAFANQMNDDQIAAVTNHVLQRFGRPDTTVSSAMVATARAGGANPFCQADALADGPWCARARRGCLRLHRTGAGPHSHKRCLKRSCLIKRRPVISAKAEMTGQYLRIRTQLDPRRSSLDCHGRIRHWQRPSSAGRAFWALSVAVGQTLNVSIDKRFFPMAGRRIGRIVPF